VNNFSPETAVRASADIYKKHKINVQSHESSARALENHYTGAKLLGHEVVRKLTRIEDASKNGVYDMEMQAQNLMDYQGDSLHQGALDEAQAAGVQIEVQQPEAQPQATK
jgi:hypothetical protein